MIKNSKKKQCQNKMALLYFYVLTNNAQQKLQLILVTELLKFFAVEMHHGFKQAVFCLGISMNAVGCLPVWI